MASAAMDAAGGDVAMAAEFILMQGGAEASASASPAPAPAPPSALVRHVIPADNSCLFAALVFCSGARGHGPAQLRQTVASAVAADPERWSEAVLGRPPAAYCDWVKKDASWGGEVELAILSAAIGLEVVAVDIKSLRFNNYNEGAETVAFVLYDGIHYDALKDGSGRTSFPAAGSDAVRESALAVARGLNQERQYTDTATFTLKCMVCGEYLKGETGAQEHAKKTGHVRFGES